MLFFCFSFKPSLAQSSGTGSGTPGIFIVYGEHGKYIIKKIDTVIYMVWISGKLRGTVVKHDKDTNKVIPSTVRPSTVGLSTAGLCKFIYKDSLGKIQEMILPCKE